MATFYTGKRSVLRGRNSNESLHPSAGYNSGITETGTYSYFANTLTSQVLDGYPDRNVEPGAGNHPHGLQMSRWFRGLDTFQPLDNPGLGEAQEDGNYRPFEFRGLTSAKILNNPGHAPRGDVYEYSGYSNFNFDGLPSAEALKDVGHAIRGIGAAGTDNTFGHFDPDTYKGVSKEALKTPGRAEPLPTATNVYGHEEVNQWYGVPSARAL